MKKKYIATSLLAGALALGGASAFADGSLGSGPNSLTGSIAGSAASMDNSLGSLGSGPRHPHNFGPNDGPHGGPHHGGPHGGPHHGGPHGGQRH